MSKNKFTYDYPRPAMAADLVVVSRERRRRVLLIRRGKEPFKGKWALPGGFVNENEPLEAAARRELEEETGLRVSKLEQLAAFGDPGRDPRGWIVSVVFLIQVDPHRVNPKAADDAADAAWHFLNDLPPLAFDHAEILALAKRRLPAPRKTNHQ